MTHTSVADSLRTLDTVYMYIWRDLAPWRLPETTRTVRGPRKGHKRAGKCGGGGGDGGGHARGSAA